MFFILSAGSNDIHNEHYTGEHGKNMNMMASEYADILFYYVYKDIEYFQALSELTYYNRFVEIYPELRLAVIVHSPGISNPSTISAQIRDQFMYQGLIVFDHDASFLQKFHFTTQSRVIFFDENNRIHSVLEPNPSHKKTDRLNWYFSVSSQISER